MIAASRHHLPQLVTAGRFREDLLYRLNTVTLTLPPLREKPEDIPLLAEFFLARYSEEEQTTTASFSPGAMQALIRYPWPGNVRELAHVIERAVALATHSVVSVDDLPSDMRSAGGSQALLTKGLPGTLSALQREHVLKVLESTGGNKERAARSLGISRRTLYRFLDRYGVTRSPSPSEPTALDSNTP